MVKQIFILVKRSQRLNANYFTNIFGSYFLKFKMYGADPLHY